MLATRTRVSRMPAGVAVVPFELQMPGWAGALGLIQIPARGARLCLTGRVMYPPLHAAGIGYTRSRHVATAGIILLLSVLLRG